jgi:hypothetical protein
MKLSSFWEGKETCWKVLECSKYVYQNCPAYLYPEQPCWEIAYTRCEILLGVKKDCQSCKVFKLYSESKTDDRSIISSTKKSS